MIRAFVFDFDGIIIDSEPVHMEAWLGILEPLGISFGDEEYRTHYLGLNDRDFLSCVGRIHGHHFSGRDMSDLIERKSIAILSLLEHHIPVLPGVREFLEVTEKRCLLAICSGANRREIEWILRRLGWSGRFQPIITADSVQRGKPDPEGYIRAFEGLAERVDDPLFPESVVAVEDSPKGIAAARAAGLRCLAVSNSYEPDALQQATWVVTSLAEADIEMLS